MEVLKVIAEACSFICNSQFWRMTVLWTLSLIFQYLRLLSQSFLFNKSKIHPRCSPKDFDLSASDVQRPVCVITGASSGLGAAAAYALSKEGFYVVLVGRSYVRLLKCMSDIKNQHPDACLKAFEVNLSSFKSIVKFKSSLQQWLWDSNMHCSIQLLINNAGILATSPRFTSEGYDQLLLLLPLLIAVRILDADPVFFKRDVEISTISRFFRMLATNYIGAFCLTQVLLPFLEDSPGPSRVVNVTSFTHWNICCMLADRNTVSGMSFMNSKCYLYAYIYEYSKLCLLVFSYELHQQVQLKEKSHHLSVVAVDPGAVKTNILREVPSCVSFLAYIALKILGLLNSPKRGVRSIVDAALAPPEVSGVYFFGGNGRSLKSSPVSYDAKLSKDIWATSYSLFQELQKNV